MERLVADQALRLARAMTTAIAPHLCPECGKVLVVRTNRKTGGEFYACPGYPECQHTEAIPEYDKMHRIGHPQLPLFDDEGT